MSIRRSLTPWLACAAAIACASTAHARATPVEGYLRCVARDRALPLRDAGAEAALLKLARYAICYRLNLAALAPCPPLPRADARQRARLRQNFWQAGLRLGGERGGAGLKLQHEALGLGQRQRQQGTVQLLHGLSRRLFPVHTALPLYSGHGIRLVQHLAATSSAFHLHSSGTAIRIGQQGHAAQWRASRQHGQQ